MNASPKQNYRRVGFVIVAVALLPTLVKFVWYESATNVTAVKQAVGRRVEMESEIAGIPVISRGSLRWAEYRFTIDRLGFFALHVSIGADSERVGDLKNVAVSRFVDPAQVELIRVIERH